jgi:hypothetical protein
MLSRAIGSCANSRKRGRTSKGRHTLIKRAFSPGTDVPERFQSKREPHPLGQLLSSIRTLAELDRVLSNRFSERCRPDCILSMVAAANEAHEQVHRLVAMVNASYETFVD